MSLAPSPMQGVEEEELLSTGDENPSEEDPCIEAWLPPAVGTPSLLDIKSYAVVCSPEDVSGAWTMRAVEVLKREGFVVILNALSQDAVAEVLKTCQEVEVEIMQKDPERIGCRDFGRYSFASVMNAAGMVHYPAWGRLLDCEPVRSLLDAALPEGWLFYSGGGDFVRGGTQNFQGLHSDTSVPAVPAELRTYWPAPTLAVNFIVQKIDTAAFGPLRLIPRRKLIQSATEFWPPLHLDEDEDMRQSLVFPLPAGAAIVRDHRLWHSGSPNVTEDTRFLPSVELCTKAYAERSKWQNWYRGLCPDVYETLSERCRANCRYIVADKSSDIPRGVKPDFHCVQATYKKGSGRDWKQAWWPQSWENKQWSTGNGQSGWWSRSAEGGTWQQQ